MLCLLALSSCIKDDIESCPARMYFHFSYLYGGVNRFFDMEKTDLTMHFYHVGESLKYRELTVERDNIGLQAPLTMEKEPLDADSLEIISWSNDPALEYVNTPEIPQGEGYIRLKEITEGSGICRPVDDLFYGYVKFDAEGRYVRKEITVPYTRPICRIRITMVPGSIHHTGGIMPAPEDYIFELKGTLDTMNDFAVPSGNSITLRPVCHYDEADASIKTDWFGAFPSAEGEFLHVDVYARDEKLADFDFAPLNIASVAGRFLDLYIDGRYIKPQMEVNVNGWKVATILSNM